MTLERNDKGKLDAYAWPGGYAIRYLCEDGESVCAKCANERKPDEWQGQAPIEGYIDWEGPTSQCANCNEDMPTEYGDPEEDEFMPKSDEGI